MEKLTIENNAEKTTLEVLDYLKKVEKYGWKEDTEHIVKSIKVIIYAYGVDCYVNHSKITEEIQNKYLTDKQ